MELWIGATSSAVAGPTWRNSSAPAAASAKRTGHSFGTTFGLQAPEWVLVKLEYSTAYYNIVWYMIV